MGPIERKGSEDLAKSSATAVDPSNLGQAPRLDSARNHFGKKGVKDKIVLVAYQMNLNGWIALCQPSEFTGHTSASESPSKNDHLFGFRFFHGFPTGWSGVDKKIRGRATVFHVKYFQGVGVAIFADVSPWHSTSSGASAYRPSKPLSAVSPHGSIGRKRF